MNKSLHTLLAALAMASTLTAGAATDDFLSFEDLNGQVKSISSKGLSITISNGKVYAANDSESMEMPLESLSALYFSETSSAALTVADTTDSRATVYTPAGLLIGTYPSVNEAVASLPAGNYVITTESQTLKIAVK